MIFTPSQYVIQMNDKVVEIYNTAGSPSTDSTHNARYAATMKPLAIINERLAHVGAKERFFVLYPGGNDGVALLIDPKIVKVLRDAHLIEGVEVPVEAK